MDRDEPRPPEYIEPNREPWTPEQCERLLRAVQEQQEKTIVTMDAGPWWFAIFKNPEWIWDAAIDREEQWAMVSLGPFEILLMRCERE